MKAYQWKDVFGFPHWCPGFECAMCRYLAMKAKRERYESLPKPKHKNAPRLQP